MIASLTRPSVGIFSPSSSIQTDRFNKGLAILEQYGIQPIIHPQTYQGSETGNQYAGSPELKAEALMDLWFNPSVDVIMASCGGNFSSQFLHLLDFEKIKNSPKTLIGFSDTTALLTAIYAKTGIGGIFGPTVQTLGRLDDVDTVLESLFEAPLKIDLSGATLLHTAKKPIKGPIFAATLSVLMSLAGTPYFPDLSGHILFIEDIGEELSHLDRLLWQLDQLYPLSSLAGLVFGECLDMKDTGRPLGLDFSSVIQKYTEGLNISQNCPVLINAPFGHGTCFAPLPLGKKAVLDTTTSPCLILE